MRKILVLCLLLFTSVAFAAEKMEVALNPAVMGGVQGANTPTYYISCGNDDTWDGSEANVDADWANGAQISTHQAGTITAIGVKIAYDDGTLDLKIQLYNASKAPLGGCTLTHPVTALGGWGTAWASCTGLSIATATDAVLYVTYSASGAGFSVYRDASGTFYSMGIAYASFPPNPYVSGGTANKCPAVRIYVTP